MAKKSTQEIISLLQQAQNVIISAKDYTTDQITQMIWQIGPNQQMYIRAASSKSTDELIKISQQSTPGKIFFDLTE